MNLFAFALFCKVEEMEEMSTNVVIVEKYFMKNVDCLSIMPYRLAGGVKKYLIVLL